MTWTLLHDAAVHLDTKHLMEIVRNNGDDDDIGQAWQVDDHGWNALAIFVVQLGHLRDLQQFQAALDAVRALLQASPQSISDVDLHGNTPLHLLVASLVSSSGGSYKNTNSDEKAQASARTAFAVSMLQLFLDACPIALSMKNLEGLMPLHMACRFYQASNDDETAAQVISLLIQAYPYALLSPIKIGSLAQLRRPTTTESPHWSPMDLLPLLPSSVEQQFETFRQQVRDGAYPLHMALAAGAPRHIIELLLAEGLEVLEQANKFGATPLHVALAHRAADDVVDCLLQHDPWRRTLHLWTQDGALPIHVAARVGCTQHVAQQLLEPCPEHVRARNGAGWTPLELAVQSGNCPEQVLKYFQEMEDSII